MATNPYDEVIDEQAAPQPKEEEELRRAYDDMFRQQDAARLAPVRTAATQAADTTPDRAVSARELGIRYGVPPSLVERNYDGYRRRAEADYATDHAKNRPGLTTWLTNQNNLALAKDDLPTLSDTEAVMRGITNTPGALAAGINEGDAVAGWAGIGWLADTMKWVVQHGGAPTDVLAPANVPEAPHDIELPKETAPREPTRLKPDEEERFRAWYAGIASQWDLNPNPDDAAQHYDYRAAFQAGAKPDPQTGHWPSTFKTAGHENLIVGGFHTQTGERVPGTKRADESTLVQLGWDPETAKQLAASPEPSPKQAFDPVRSLEWISDFARATEIYAKQNTKLLQGDRTDAGPFEQWYYSGVESAGFMVPSLVLGYGAGTLAAGAAVPAVPLSAEYVATEAALRASTTASLGTMFAQTGAQSYSQGREAGLGYGRATVFAGLQAAVEVATEALPAHLLFDRVIKKSPFLKFLGWEQLSEHVGEQIATALQDFNEWAFIDSNKGKTFADYMHERPNAALGTFVATLVTGGVMGAIGAVHEHGIERLNELARASKLRQRSASAFNDFAKTVSPNGKVYFDAEPFQQYWQSQGEDPAAKAAELTGDPQALATAIERGQPLEVPLANYATTVAGTEHAQFFGNILRRTPGGPNIVEYQQAEDLRARMEAETAEAAGAAPPQRETHRDQLVKAMVAAGHPRHVAEVVGTMAALGFHSLEEAGQLGPLFRRYGITFAQPELGQQGDVRISAEAPLPPIPLSVGAVLRTNQGEPIPIDHFTPEEQQRLRARDLVETSTTPAGETVEHVDPQKLEAALQPQREAARMVPGAPSVEPAAAAPAPQAPTTTTHDEQQRNKRAAFAAMVESARQSATSVFTGETVTPTEDAAQQGAAEQLAKYQALADERGEPMVVYRTPTGTVGTHPLSTGGLTENTVAVLYPTQAVTEAAAAQAGAETAAAPSAPVAPDTTVSDTEGPPHGARLEENRRTDRERLSREGSLPPSRPRERETPAKRELRKARHLDRVFNEILGYARELDESVDPAALRAEFDYRLRVLDEREEALRGEDVPTSRNLLEAIAAHGGLGRDATDPGGVEFLQEGQRFGIAQGVRGVFQAVTKNKSNGQRITGHTLDGMLRLLEGDPRFTWIKTPNDLWNAVDDAIRHPLDDPGGTYGGTHEYVADLDMWPSERWWDEPVRPMPTAAAVTPPAAPALSVEEQLVAAQQELAAEREKRQVLQHVVRSEVREKEVDPLTGVGSRVALAKALGVTASTLADAPRMPGTSVIIFDANNFKVINKIHDQSTGDAALVQMAQGLKQAATEAGIGPRVFRLNAGGDEFVILAPEESAEAVRDRAERVVGVTPYVDTEGRVPGGKPGDVWHVSMTGNIAPTLAEAERDLQARKGERKAQDTAPPPTTLEQGLFDEETPPAAPADVPLPGLEGVRQTETPTPAFEAPFTLTGEPAPPATKDEQRTLFQTEEGAHTVDDKAPAAARFDTAPVRVSGDAAELSTQVPKGANQQPASDMKRTDMALVKSAPTAPGKKPLLVRFANVIRDYPQITNAERESAKTPEELINALIGRMKQNLRFLWNKYEEEHGLEVVKRAAKWYVGAHRIARRLTTEFNISLQQASAVLASLSPQMDWFKNVSLAERTIKWFFQFERDNPQLSAEMLRAHQERELEVMEEKLDEILEKGKGERPVGEGFVAMDDPQEYAEEVWQDFVHKQADERNWVGVAWRDLPLEAKAIMLRGHDELTSKEYHVILPEGDTGELKRNKDKERTTADVGWGAYQFIENAISILQDGRMANITQRLGGEHKVRSFYNNIINPWSGLSVTIDTHAGAAALLEPLAGGDKQIVAAMSGPGADAVGISGTNAIFAEAYFQLAEELSQELGFTVLPREVQSVTWEAGRGLFKPEQKREKQKTGKGGEKIPTLQEDIHALWRQFAAGTISLDELHERIYERAGRIESPDWKDTPSRLADDEGELRARVDDQRSRAHQLPAGRGDRGAGAAVARGADADQLGRPAPPQGIISNHDDAAIFDRATAPVGRGVGETRTLNQPLGDETPSAATPTASPFYSRLTRAVETSTLTKASGAQWKATIANAKIGINRDEFALTRVTDLEDDTPYTKQEVLDYLGRNAVRVEPVVLGDTPAPTWEQIRARTEEIYEERVAQRLRDIDDRFDRRADFLPLGETSVGYNEEEGGWEAAVDGEDLDFVYDTEAEAQDAADAEAQRLREHAEDQARQDQLEHAREMVSYDDAEDQAREELEEAGSKTAVRYGEYVEPGAEPGTYREMFLTATLPGTRSREARNAEYRQMTAIANRRGYVEVRQDIHGDQQWHPVDARGNWADDGYATKAEAEQHIDPEIVRARARVQEIQQEMARADQTWEDGHAEYSDIQNPIVRLRSNIRTTTDGQRVLFIEEAQPPHVDEFAKMPPLFQKNWREMAFKYALRIAAEQHLDGVAWTTGAQQAARYSLERQVESIAWKPSPDGSIRVDIPISDRRYVVLRVKPDGQIFDTNSSATELAGKSLATVVGKEVAQRILSEPEGKLEGEGLKIGGEGLKKLYDVDFPNVVKGLPAVKRHGGRVETVALGMRRLPHPERERLRAIGIEEIKPGVWTLRLNDQTTSSQYYTAGAASQALQEWNASLNAPQQQPQPAVMFTPAMREAALGGQALFQPDEGAPPPAEGAAPTPAPPATPRGNVQVGPGREEGQWRHFTINSFAKQNLSTLLHEFGHVFFFVTGDVADQLRAMDPASLSASQKQLLADHQAMLDYMGAKPGEPITDAQHEKFARGFELYLREGKAPSLELRSVFSRFRSWLLNIYENVRQLAYFEGIELNPEITAVFDRMLATDEQIRQAQAESNMDPLFLTREQAGMTAAEWDLYRKKVGDQSRLARERLERKMQAEVTREQTAAYQARRAEVQREVEDEVHQRPEYRALAAMRDGTHPDGTPLSGEADEEARPWKLSRKILVDRFGEDRVKALPAGITTTAEEGLDPDLLAEMFGFTSGDEMLRALTGAPRMEYLVKAAVDQRMRAEFGDKQRDGTLPADAQAAVLNDGREEILRAELEALQKLQRVASRGPVRAAVAEERAKGREAVKAARVEGREQLAAAQKERTYERRWLEAETRLRIAIAEGHKQVKIDELRTEVDRLKAQLEEARATARGLREQARRGGATIAKALPPARVVREAARQTIARTRVRDITPQVYWSAARKASQEATAAAAKQDFAGAIAAKQKELLNTALYRAAVAALEDVDSRARAARALDTTASRQRLGLAGGSYQDQIDGILDRYEFARVSNVALERRADIAKWVAALEGEGYAVNLPAAVLADTRKVNYRDVTYEELVGITDGLAQIVHLARLKNKLLTAKKQRDYRTTRNAMVTAIQESKPAREKQVSGYRRADEPTRRIDGWFASHTKLAEFIARLDGYVTGGAVWNAIMRPINEAGTREASLLEQAGTIMGDSLKRHYRAEEIGRMGGPTATQAALGLGKDTLLFIPAIGTSLTKEERLAVALNWGNDGNRQRLMEAGARGWNAAQVQAILDTLDARDLKFVQETIDHINSYWDEIAAKQKRVTGVAPEKVEATSWTHGKYGEQRGGYYPIAYDQRLDARAAAIADADSANLQQHAAYAYASTRRGHTEARVERNDQPIRLQLSVAYEHVAQVIHDLTHHEMLIDVGRLLADRQIQQAILSRQGDIVYKQMRDAVLDIALGTRHATTMVDRALNYARAGGTIAGLGWNFWTSLQQPAGLFNAAATIGPKWVMRGLVRFLRDTTSMEHSARWVYEKSEMMRLRGRTYNREVADLRNTLQQPGSWFDTALRTISNNKLEQEDITHSFLWMIEKAQNLADMPTWIGAYERYRSEGEEEDRAIALADQAVLDSQSGGQIKDLAKVQRGSPAFKLWTMFYSYGNLLYNQTARTYNQTDFKRLGSTGQFAGNLMLLYVMPAVVTALLAKAFGKSGDDEPWYVRMGTEILGAAMNTMVLAREFAGLVQQAATGETRGARGYEGPTGTRLISSVYRAGQQAIAGKYGRTFVRAAEDTAGVIFKLPLGQIQRSIDGFTALTEGKTHNPLVMLTGAPKAANQ